LTIPTLFKKQKARYQQKGLIQALEKTNFEEYDVIAFG